jgi:hypothetical protein
MGKHRQSPDPAWKILSIAFGLIFLSCTNGDGDTGPTGPTGTTATGATGPTAATGGTGARPLPSTQPNFLSLRGGGRPPGEDVEADAEVERKTNEYYVNIEAYTTVPTLNDFKRVFGVDDPVAYYYNAADLGFGREMHCTKKLIPALDGTFVACYVSNYGGVGVGPEDTFPLLEQHDVAQSFATVAMVYLRIGDPPYAIGELVRFYVYAPDENHPEERCQVPSANPCLSDNGAALDSQDGKPVPEMCMACHGGTLDGSNDSFPNSSFLPFNVFSFRYSSEPGFQQRDQEEAFRRLNDIVRLTRPGCVPEPAAGPATDAICDFIVESYQRNLDDDEALEGAVDVAETTARPYVPDEWPGSPDKAGDPANYYTEVVLPFCGSCHFSLGFTRDWASFDEWVRNAPVIHSRVCGRKDMPHAELPWKNLWLSDSPHYPDSFIGSPVNGLDFGAVTCNAN